MSAYLICNYDNINVFSVLGANNINKSLVQIEQAIIRLYITPNRIHQS